jgi:transposase-like protein
MVPAHSIASGHNFETNGNQRRIRMTLPMLDCLRHEQPGDHQRYVPCEDETIRFASYNPSDFEPMRPIKRKEKAIALFGEGLGVVDIARVLKVSRNRVMEFLSEASKAI